MMYFTSLMALPGFMSPNSWTKVTRSEFAETEPLYQKIPIHHPQEWSHKVLLLSMHFVVVDKVEFTEMLDHCLPSYRG